MKFAHANRRLKKSLGLAAVLMLSGASAAVAQNLSPSQEGRLVVGQCYATCLDRARRAETALSEKADRLTALLISDEFMALTQESKSDLLELEENAICILVQGHVRSLDGCHAGCVDAEAAYGVASAHARNRFLRLLRAQREPSRTAGLWTDYRTSPAPGTAVFDDACDRYLQNADDALLLGDGTAATLSLLPSLGDRAIRTAKPRLQEGSAGVDRRPAEE